MSDKATHSVIGAGEAQALLNYLDRRQAEMVTFLSDLVVAESPSSEPDAQEAVQDHLRRAFVRLGYAVELLPGGQTGGHLLIQPPHPASDNYAGRQLLLGHCDTVWPIGTLWQMPLQLEGNILRGPGVFDMKAGLTQIVFALRALADLGLEPALSPVILINSDEEIGSPESAPIIEELAKSSRRVFVLEPALGHEGKLKTARKGVGRYTVTVQGRSAHAGLEPEKGISAILELSHVIQQLFALNDFEKGVTVNVGRVEGGSRPNVIAATGSAEVDVRAPTLADAHRLDQAILSIQATLPGATVQITRGIHRPPLERTPANQQLWQLAYQQGQLLGLDLEQGSAGGGSDGNITSQYSPTLDGLGAVGDGAHAQHEFVYVDRLVERCALLALLLLAPANDIELTP